MTASSVKQEMKALRTRLQSDQTDPPAGDAASILKTIFQISPGLLFYLDKDGVRQLSCM